MLECQITLFFFLCFRDFSLNSLTGDLPESFSSLSSITTMWVFKRLSCGTNIFIWLGSLGYLISHYTGFCKTTNLLVVLMSLPVFLLKHCKWCINQNASGDSYPFLFFRKDLLFGPLLCSFLCFLGMLPITILLAGFLNHWRTLICSKRFIVPLVAMFVILFL